MKIIDCYWERRNLGCNAVEVRIETGDSLTDLDFEQLNKYDYVVIKVPVNKVEFNYGLANCGYVMFELQMDMYANMNSFNFEEKNIKRLLPHVDFQEVKTMGELNLLLSKITPNMFTTDRISMDPDFGSEKGCLRYKNWVCDEFDNPASKTINIFYKNQNVGFATFKEDVEYYGLIGGLFADYQNDGIGLLTPCFAPLFLKWNNSTIKKIHNPISSNNKAVWDLYEFFGYIPKNADLVSHVELKTTVMGKLIKEIIIGPKGLLTASEIYTFLISCGIIKSKAECDIIIRKSNSTYR